MIELLNELSDRIGVDARYVILSGLFFGSLLVFIAIVTTVRGRPENRVSRRMRGAGRVSAAATRGNTALATRSKSTQPSPKGPIPFQPWPEA